MRKNILTLCMVFYIIGVHAQTAGGVFEPGPPMQTSRIATAIGATASGEFLFFGGRSYGFVSSAFTDVFNPETMVFTNVNMLYPHDNAVVIKTEDGRFFIAGGGYNLGVPAYNTAEWYDPETRTFSDAGTMLYSRMQGTGIQLTDGRLLIVGGWYDPTAAVQTELYDPASGTSTAAGSLIQARSSALVLPCDDGGAVVFGGYPTYGGNYLAGVEYFDPVTNTFSVLQDELIADEPGYYTTYDNANKEEPSLFQLADGRYVFLAWRTDPVIEYILVSFDPATKVFERIHLNTPLKSDLTDGGFVEMTINFEEHLAYLLAADAEAAGAGLSLVTVDLNTGNVYQPSINQYFPDYTWLVFGNMVYVPQLEKILFVGVSTSGTDYFNATTGTYLITPDYTVDINEPVYQPKCEVYPNPSQGILEVYLEVKEPSSFTFTITDMAGRKMCNEIRHAAIESNYKWRLDLQDFPSGTYNLLIMGNDIQITKRIIIVD